MVLTQAMLFFEDPNLINTNNSCFWVTSIPGDTSNLLIMDQGRDLITLVS